MRQRPFLCQSGEIANLSQHEPLAAQSGLAYIAGMTTVGKAEFAICLTLAAAGTCLYAARLGGMVRDRLSHSHLTLASNLTAIFPVYQWLVLLAIVVPKSAEFMHVLMAAYSMIVFNNLANLLAFRFGAIRYILGPRCVLANQSDCEDGARVTVLKTKPLWSRFQLLMVRAAIRQGQLLHCINVAASAAIQLDNSGPPLQWRQQQQQQQQPWEQPQIDSWLVWLRGFAAASRLAGSFAAVVLVARCCCRGSSSSSARAAFVPPPLLPGYRLGAKFAPLAAASFAQTALQGAAFIADFLTVGGAVADEYGEIALHAQCGLQLLLSVLQAWSLVEFQLGSLPPLPASLTAAPQAKPQPQPQNADRSRSPMVTAELSVDDSVPAEAAAAAASATAAGAPLGHHCRACQNHLTVSTDDGCSRDASSATTQVFGY